MTFLPASGEVFAGRYRIDGRLGQGGHGAVFRAADLEGGGVVALKLLLPEQLDGVGRDRFRREAELGERLANPHSVRLHDWGEDAHGLPYIAFELLEGRSLGRFLEERGPQPPEVVARVARAMLEALADAHELGMIHRDIKPANVFLCDYAGSHDFVKVLDFGIAKRSGRDATQLTATDVVVGTARYMAPEQLRGEEVTPATDLYSVGLVMAEMLAGAPVFRGSTIEVCLAQVSSDPVPLSERVLSSSLGPAIVRATDKHPGRRFATARAMLEALPSATPRTLIDDPDGETAVMGPPPALAAVPTSTPAFQAPLGSSPVFAAVPTSAPVYPSVPPGSSPVFAAVPTSAPVYPSLPPGSLAPQRSSASGPWALGLVAAFLLLAALIAAGAWLVASPTTPEEPPPMPSARQRGR